MINYQNDIEKATEVIQQGGLILYPTDTIWGIGADATNADAIKKVYHLKQRDDKKSLIILLSTENELKNYVENVSNQILDFIHQTKKPTTIIYPTAKNLPQNLINEDGTIAIRIVKDEFCKMLIHKINVPLISTSANISTQPSPKNFLEVSTEIKKGVDYIVQHRQNDFREVMPSSIVKFNEDETMLIIR